MAAAGVVGTVGARSFHPPGRKLHISSSRKFFVAQKYTISHDFRPLFYTFPVARSPKRGRSNHRCLEVPTKSSEKSWKIPKKMIFECWGVGVCVQILKSATQKHTKIHFGRVNRRSSWAKTHRRRSGWRDLDQSGNIWEISKIWWRDIFFGKS